MATLENNSTAPLNGWERLTLLAIAVASAGLILYQLGTASLIGDEITVAYIGPESIPEILRLTFVDIIDPAYGRNRPLFNLLVHAALKLVDDLETAARLPSASAGILGVLLLFRLARRVAPKRVALAAAALFGASHGQLWASRSATAYAPMVVCVILALTAAADALRTGRASAWARTGAWCAIGYYFHPVMAFASLSILGGSLFALWAPATLTARPSEQTRFRPTLACLGTGLVLMLPALWCIGWLVWWSYGAPPEAAPYDPNFMDTGRPTISFEHQDYRLVREITAFLGSGTSLGFGVIAALCVLGLAALFSTRTRSFAWLALAILTVPIAMLLSVPFAHGFGARYLIFLLPLIVLLAARGLATVIDVASHGARWSAPALTLATLALAAANGPHWYARDPRVPVRDWNTIASEVEQRTTGRTIVLIGSAGTAAPTPDPAGRRELALYFENAERFTTCTPGARSTQVWADALASLRESDELVALALDGELFEFEPWRADRAIEVSTLPGGWLLSSSDRAAPAPERLARLLIALAQSGVSLSDAGTMMIEAYRALWSLPSECPSLELFDTITAWEQALDPLAGVPFRASFARELRGVKERAKTCPPALLAGLRRYVERRGRALGNACARATLMARDAGDLRQAVEFALCSTSHGRYDTQVLNSLIELCGEAEMADEIDQLEHALGERRAQLRAKRESASE